MNLEQLLTKPDITDLENDSRKIKPGMIFLAYPGVKNDGRLFIETAHQAGASAIIYDPHNFPSSVQLPKDIPCMPLPQLNLQLAKIASQFYKNPSAQLSITGVTGTNGKTTIAFLLAQAYAKCGRIAKYIGTIGYGSFDKLQEIVNTTPDALFLQKLMANYVKANVKEICMEVSSHALDQARVEEIAFKQAIFTNLTREHLDYHQNMEAYAAAKAKLFSYPSLQTAILNNDDEYSVLMQQQLSNNCRKITYGLKAGADVWAKKFKLNMHSSYLEVHSPWGQYNLEVNLLGKFNVYNTLAIFSSLLANDVDSNQIEAIMANLNPALGRMEIVHKSPYVLVDYAHTPDALENALATLAELKQGKLLVVFGCGGDRDKGKRKIMGEIASKYADFVIITSDNPRSENPEAIIEEIASGVTNKNAKKIVDRKEAIAFALDIAKKQDMILVAGKGHEDYQIIGQEKFHFSDQEVIKTLLA